jgi:hypothetical protein
MGLCDGNEAGFGSQYDGLQRCVTEDGWKENGCMQDVEPGFPVYILISKYTKKKRVASMGICDYNEREKKKKKKEK